MLITLLLAADAERSRFTRRFTLMRYAAFAAMRAMLRALPYTKLPALIFAAAITFRHEYFTTRRYFALIIEAFSFRYAFLRFHFLSSEHY